MSPGDGLFDDGAAYEQLMGRWSRRVGEIFNDWLDAPANLRWIDVGCGTGVFTVELIKHCSPETVTAIDHSAEQLAYAHGRPGLGSAELRVGDAQGLSFADDSFDFAVMALVIHFVPDPSKAVPEMARVVRPEGWVASYAWDYTTGGSPTAPVVAAMKALCVEAPARPSAAATSMPALQELWRSAGLEAIETRAIAIPVEFASFDAFWRASTLPVGPAGKAIAAMSPGTLEQLRALARERASLEPDGRVVIEARANAIKGRVGT